MLSLEGSTLHKTKLLLEKDSKQSVGHQVAAFATPKLLDENYKVYDHQDKNVKLGGLFFAITKLLEEDFRQSACPSAYSSLYPS